MAKIKNWSRYKSGEYGDRYYHWKHDEKNDSVRVLYYDGPTGNAGNKQRGYYVIHNYPYKSGQPASKSKIIQDGFSSKEKARKVAVKWIKKHPNP